MTAETVTIPSAQQELAAITRQRILLAVQTLFNEMWLADISIQAVATQANVSVQSIYRHFDSREGLIDQFLEELVVSGEKYPIEASPGNIYAIVNNLMSYYHRHANMLLRIQMQAQQSAKLEACWENIQNSHLNWVRANFAVYLESLSRQRQIDMEDQLIWLTDITCWRVYCQELGRSAQELEQSMTHVLRAFLQSYR